MRSLIGERMEKPRDGSGNLGQVWQVITVGDWQ